MRFKLIRIGMRIIRAFVRVSNYNTIRKISEYGAARLFKIPSPCAISDIKIKDMPARWVSWDGSDERRTVLYLHGGGYVICSPRTHADLLWRISRSARARILAPDYRLAPENRHPAAVDDALSAYRWLLEGGTEPSRIAVMGDSAGGGLTLVLLQLLRDRGLPLPACAVCISPWTDLSCSGSSMKEKKRKDPLLSPRLVKAFASLYADEVELQNPAVSPVFGDFSDLPPILIQVGSDEILLDDSERVAGSARDSGTLADLEVWPGMCHVWHALAHFIPEGKYAIKRIGSFIESHIPASV